MRNKVLRIFLRVLLAVSLLVNVVGIGLLLRAIDLRNEAGLQDTRLPRDLRVAFREVARDDPALITQLQALGDARRVMMAAAATRPLDQEALDAAMAEVRAQTAALQVEGQRILRQVMIDAAR